MYRKRVAGPIGLSLIVTALSLTIAAQSTTTGVFNPPGSTDTNMGGANLISGMVIAPNGQRIMRRITVRLRSMLRGDLVSMTDDNGTFAFAKLPDGEYTIVIDKEPDYEPFTQAVQVIQPRGFPAQVYNLSVKLKAKQGTGDAKPGVVNSELAGVPESALVYYRKAAELAKNNDHNAAIEQLKLAIKEFPKFTLAYNDLGVQYLKLGEVGPADDAFKTALNIDSTSFAPLLNHGIALFSMTRYTDAEAVFRSVIKANSGSAPGHFFLGQSLAYSDKAKWSEAEKELSTALTLGGEAMAPQLKDAHYILGLIYAEKGDKKKQIASWENYLKLAPDAPNAEQIRQAVARLKGT